MSWDGRCGASFTTRSGELPSGVNFRCGVGEVQELRPREPKRHSGRHARSAELLGESWLPGTGKIGSAVFGIRSRMVRSRDASRWDCEDQRQSGDGVHQHQGRDESRHHALQDGVLHPVVVLQRGSDEEAQPDSSGDA